MKKNCGLIILLCASIALGGCAQKTDSEVEANVEVQEQVTTIETMKAEKGEIESTFLYSGKVKPVTEANVASTIQGKVAKINFDVGDKVNKNDVLFEMDTVDIQNNINTLKAQLASAQASVQSAQTNIDLANGTAMQSQIEAAKSGLETAEIAYNNSKNTYENNKILYEQNIISKTEFDNIELAYKNAEINYNKAKDSYEIVNKMPEENLRKAQDGLNSAKASVKIYETNIASAQKSLTDAKVKSPINGVVTSRTIEEGVLLSQAAVPMTIADMSTVNLVVSVSEQIVNDIHSDDVVGVKIAAISDDSIQGKVTTVSPAANQGGTYDVKIEIPNESGIIKSGMFGEVSFVKEKTSGTIILPRSCVITKNDENYVFVNENNIAVRKDVSLGIDSGDKIEVLSGLEEGMDVIIKGQSYLEDGDKVVTSSEVKGE